jgi:putative molybdopterin biosynthesis protein
LNLSYRHVWGQLKAWEAELGHELLVWDRGQSARLTPFADKLLWAERLAQARLAPQIGALKAELERAMATVFDESTQVLALHASYDDALSGLQHHAATAHQLHLDIQFTGSVDAIRALNEGRCQMAGFHTRPFPNRDSLSARIYKPLLRPGQHKIIGFVLRHMGLIVEKDNPLNLLSLEDVIASRARWINRPLGTGTRVLLDEWLGVHGYDGSALKGYDTCQPSHAAVAQAVASGQADAGLGTASTARAAGLGFVPLVQERYQLVCLKSELDSPPVQTLRHLLSLGAWYQTLNGLHGYTPDYCGQVQALNQWLPWWSFKS